MNYQHLRASIEVNKQTQHQKLFRPILSKDRSSPMIPGQGERLIYSSNKNEIQQQYGPPTEEISIRNTWLNSAQESRRPPTHGQVGQHHQGIQQSNQKRQMHLLSGETNDIYNQGMYQQKHLRNLSSDYHTSLLQNNKKVADIGVQFPSVVNVQGLSMPVNEPQLKAIQLHLAGKNQQTQHSHTTGSQSPRVNINRKKRRVTDQTEQSSSVLDSQNFYSKKHRNVQSQDKLSRIQSRNGLLNKKSQLLTSHYSPSRKDSQVGNIIPGGLRLHGSRIIEMQNGSQRRQKNSSIDGEQLHFKEDDESIQDIQIEQFNYNNNEQIQAAIAKPQGRVNEHAYHSSSTSDILQTTPIGLNRNRPPQSQRSSSTAKPKKRKTSIKNQEIRTSSHQFDQQRSSQKFLQMRKNHALENPFNDNDNVQQQASLKIKLKKQKNKAGKQQLHSTEQSPRLQSKILKQSSKQRLLIQDQDSYRGGLKPSASAIQFTKNGSRLPSVLNNDKSPLRGSGSKSRGIKYQQKPAMSFGTSNSNSRLNLRYTEESLRSSIQQLQNKSSHQTLPNKRISSKQRHENASNIQSLKNKLNMYSQGKLSQHQSVRNSVIMATGKGPSATGTNSGLASGLISGSSTTKAGDKRNSFFRQGLIHQMQVKNSAESTQMFNTQKAAASHQDYQINAIDQQPKQSQTAASQLLEIEKNKKYQNLTKSVAYENEGQLKNFEIFEKVSLAGGAKDSKIKVIDTHLMISKVAKDLKMINYNINRCVQSGLTNFIKLHVTSKLEMQIYRDKFREFMDRHRAGKNKSTIAPVFNSPETQIPWTTIQFVTQDPIMAYVEPENRIGAIRFVFKGNIPKDLKVCISENFQVVNEQNASWTYIQPSVFTLLPREQNILNPSKQSDRDSKQFKVLYLSFQTSKDDAKFNLQVTFPDEEEYEQRRRMASDQLNKAMGGATRGKDQKMAQALKRTGGGGDGDSIDQMTLEEKAELAETRFKAIADVVQAKLGPDRYQTKVDFVEQNMNCSDHQKPTAKLDMIQRKMQLLQDRTHVAKQKRDYIQKEQTRIRLLQLNKWAFIKIHREKEFEKMEERLTAMRWSKSWCLIPQVYNVIQKAFKNYSAYSEKKIIEAKKLDIVRTLTHKWQIQVRCKGPTFEFRLINQFRHTLAVSINTQSEAIRRQAKQVLTYFTTKRGQQVGFRESVLSFKKSISLINSKMRSRMATQKIQKHWLERFFDQEAEFLLGHAQKHMKSKKYKRYNTLLIMVCDGEKNEQKYAVLKEYYDLCKLIYRIRDTVAYCKFTNQGNFYSLKALFNENPGFTKMVKTAQRLLFNVFIGTESKQPTEIPRFSDRGSAQERLDDTRGKKKLKNAVSGKSPSDFAKIFSKANKLAEDQQRDEGTNSQSDLLYNQVNRKDCIVASLATFAMCEQLTTPIFWQKIEKIKNNAEARVSMYESQTSQVLSVIKIQRVSGDGTTNYQATTNTDGFIQTQSSIKSTAQQDVVSNGSGRQQNYQQSSKAAALSSQQQQQQKQPTTSKQPPAVSIDTANKDLNFTSTSQFMSKQNSLPGSNKAITMKKVEFTAPYAQQAKPMRNQQRSQDRQQSTTSPERKSSTLELVSFHGSTVSGTKSGDRHPYVAIQSPKKQRQKTIVKKKTTVMLDLSTVTILDLFPNFEETKVECRQQIVQEIINSCGWDKERFIPSMEYLPSKEVMRRIVMRCAEMPSHFEGFDRDIE